MNDDIACQSLGVFCGADGGTFAIFVVIVIACAIVAYTYPEGE